MAATRGRPPRRPPPRPPALKRGLAPRLPCRGSCPPRPAPPPRPCPGQLFTARPLPGAEGRESGHRGTKCRLPSPPPATGRGEETKSLAGLGAGSSAPPPPFSRHSGQASAALPHRRAPGPASAGSLLPPRPHALRGLPAAPNLLRSGAATGMPVREASPAPRCPPHLLARLCRQCCLKGIRW